MQEFLGMISDKYGTQTACAKALGWPKQKLNRIALGQTMPSLEDVQALAKALNKPVGVIANIFLQKTSQSS